MIICKTCGKQLKEDAQFCSECGEFVANTQAHESTPIPIPQAASFEPKSDKRRRLVRSFAAVLAALIIATMLLGWINIHIDIDGQTTNDIANRLDEIVADWIEVNIYLLDVEGILHEVRDHDVVNARVDEFVDEILDSIRQDFGDHIELESDFGMADVFTDEVIGDLVADADEVVGEILDEIVGETMYEIRYIIIGISGLSFSASYSVYSLAYLTRLVANVGEAVQAVAADSGFDMSNAVLAANILRVVWAVCILLLVLFLFLLTAEFKAARLVGLIGTGFASILALAFAIGLFVGNSRLTDVFGGVLQFGAAIWVYVCLGLSLAAVVLIIKLKRFDSGFY